MNNELLQENLYTSLEIESPLIPTNPLETTEIAHNSGSFSSPTLDSPIENTFTENQYLIEIGDLVNSDSFTSTSDALTGRARSQEPLLKVPEDLAAQDFNIAESDYDALLKRFEANKDTLVEIPEEDLNYTSENISSIASKDQSELTNSDIELEEDVNNASSESNESNGGEIDNEIDNEQDNEIDNEQDNEIDNEQDNEIDNGQDNEIDNGQDNEIDNEQDNEIDNEQDNEIDDEQDNEIDDEQIIAAVPLAPVAAVPGGVIFLGIGVGGIIIYENREPIAQFSLEVIGNIQQFTQDLSDIIVEKGGNAIDSLPENVREALSRIPGFDLDSAPDPEVTTPPTTGNVDIDPNPAPFPGQEEIIDNIKRDLEDAGFNTDQLDLEVPFFSATPADILEPSGNPIGTAGTDPTIREITGNQADALELFFKLLATDGGAYTDITPPGYAQGGAGFLARLAGGGVVGVRDISFRSPTTNATVDVNIPGVNITKVKYNK